MISRRQWWFTIIALMIGLFVAGFGIGRAFIGWTKVATPCNDIQAIGGTAAEPMVVCAEEPGVILIKQ